MGNLDGCKGEGGGEAFPGPSLGGYGDFLHALGNGNGKVGGQEKPRERVSATKQSPSCQVSFSDPYTRVPLLSTLL